MPNEVIVKRLVAGIIPMIFLLITPAARSADRGGGQGTTPCGAFSDFHEPLAVAHLCIVLTPMTDEQPLYVQVRGGVTYRFVVSEAGLALAMPADELTRLRADPALLVQLVAKLPVDLLQTWHQDALHWWHWLLDSDGPWTGKPPTTA